MANTIDVYGDGVVFASIIGKSISEYEDSDLTAVTINSFRLCTQLSKVDLPNVSTVYQGCFSGCGALTTVNLPNASQLFDYAFYGCSSLTSISIPKASTVGTGVFRMCRSLSLISLSDVSTLEAVVFADCTSLESVYLLGSNVCKLKKSNAFNSTPITVSSYLGHFGSIYVPSSLVSAYKSATNWTNYADRITAYTGE